MKSVSVSVCVVVHNASRYVRECIESILQQTFGDFELLIVDESSADDSCDIIRSYCDPRIRLIEHTNSRADSLNLLFDLAKGKYIACMEVGDVMLPYRLESQFKYMEQNPSVDVLGGLAEKIPNLLNDTLLNLEGEKEITVQDLLKSNCLIFSTVFVRIESLRRKRIKYESTYVNAEDYWLWARCLMRGLAIKISPEVLVKHRIWTKKEQVTLQNSELIPEVEEKLQNCLGEWSCKKQHGAYRNPRIKKSGNKLTAIIPFLNEGDEVIRTVESLRRHVGSNIDIITINDCSTDGYPYQVELEKYDVYYILNRRRRGVAASRDIGVTLCRTPYFLLLDAHMRVYEGDWLSTTENLLEYDDRQLICMQTRVLHKDGEGRVIEASKKNSSITYGAYHPFNFSSYLPDITWNTTERMPDSEIEEIAVVLGAGYAASKRYWTYLKGLKGLLYYGSDEAYISIKVWMEGGKCVLLKNHEFGHVYRTTAPYQHYIDKNIYNCLLIAHTIYPLNYRSWVYAIALSKDRDLFFRANNLLAKRAKYINELKTYYDGIFNVSFYDILPMHRFCVKNIDVLLSERMKLLPKVMDFITHRKNEDYGLYNGIAGEVIWLMHYERFTSTNLSMYWEPLLDKIDDAVLNGKLPMNFAHGLCGIGWMYMYLYCKGFIPYPNMRVIKYIDRQLQIVDVERIDDYSFATGIGGFICYFYIRLFNETLECGLTSKKEQIYSIQKKIKKVLKKATDVLTIYNAFRFIEAEKQLAHSEYVNTITDCLSYPESLSEDMQYWNSGLYRGCIGYTLPCMTISES